MIKTFDNKEWNYIDIIKRMYDDDFYYGYLGSNALSSSSAKKLLQSPKAYLKSLNVNSNAQPLRDGRLVHLSVLEPHKVKDLTIIDGSKATKELITQTKALYDLADTSNNILEKMVNQEQNWFTKVLMKFVK